MIERSTAIKSAVVATYLIGVIVLMIRSYPDAAQKSALAGLQEPRGQISGPFPLVESSNRIEPVTFNFRSDVGRQGWENFVLSPELSESWRFHALNVGVHGASKASPAVDDSGVYVGGDGAWFYAFELDGRKRWQIHFSRAAKGIHATASLDQNSVYLGAYDGRLYRVDKASGEVLWTLHLGIALGSSTVLHEGVLYVGVETAHPDGYVIAVRAETGEILWTSKWLGGHPHSSPALWPEKSLLFIGANSSRLFAFDMKTGQEVWHSLSEGPIKGTPMVFEGRVYVASWGRKVFALDGLSGEVIWETYLGDASQSSTTLVPPTREIIVATSNGGGYWLSADTGAIRHSVRFDGLRGLFSASVTRGPAGSWIAWMPCESSSLCAWDAIRARPLRKWDFEGPLTGIPTVTPDGLYVAFSAPTGLVALKPRGARP